MLDVITDFWKPVKKAPSSQRPDLEKLQVGSRITFGSVPQALLGGRTFKVASINTYQFGDERMTSFALALDKDDSISMIVAGEGAEQYLAISRRIPFAERMKMFDPAELERVLELPPEQAEEESRLIGRAVEGGWKHWLVTLYRREIAGIKGSIAKGDYRAQAQISPALAQPFDYTLLVSESNEYAIEAEKYADGRVELYATIYRRLSDVDEVEHPKTSDPRLASVAQQAAPVLEVVRPEPAPAPEEKIPEEKAPEASAPVAEAVAPAPVAAEPEKMPPEKIAQEIPQEIPQEITQQIPPQPQAKMPENEVEKPVAKEPEKTAEAAPAAPAMPEAANAAKANQAQDHSFFKPTPKPIAEETSMQLVNNAHNGNGAADKSNLESLAARAVSTGSSSAENDAVECDLRVANRIIEEAIRNEMRLSDVVRRVIALPVANPESVHIPVTLSDADYQLLAIRYGISAGDKNAIKLRIIEELGDFTGKKD